jgi:hypothetical protein
MTEVGWWQPQKVGGWWGCQPPGAWAAGPPLGGPQKNVEVKQRTPRLSRLLRLPTPEALTKLAGSTPMESTAPKKVGGWWGCQPPGAWATGPPSGGPQKNVEVKQRTPRLSRPLRHPTPEALTKLAGSARMTRFQKKWAAGGGASRLGRGPQVRRQADRKECRGKAANASA